LFLPSHNRNNSEDIIGRDSIYKIAFAVKSKTLQNYADATCRKPPKMANPDHLKTLQEGVDAWNAWIKSHVNPDLSGGHLTGPHLRAADLRNADLRVAHLSEANLYWARLFRANLSRANLSGANFHRALLSEADLSEANLVRANLGWADRGAGYGDYWTCRGPV
jgi:uncharacterized protein YjbI with pentapeptide repeats